MGYKFLLFLRITKMKVRETGEFKGGLLRGKQYPPPRGLYNELKTPILVPRETRIGFHFFQFPGARF